MTGEHFAEHLTDVGGDAEVAVFVELREPRPIAVDLAPAHGSAEDEERRRVALSVPRVPFSATFDHRFTYRSGSLAEFRIGQSTIDVLEGTREAFTSRMSSTTRPGREVTCMGIVDDPSPKDRRRPRIGGGGGDGRPGRLVLIGRRRGRRGHGECQAGAPVLDRRHHRRRGDHISSGGGVGVLAVLSYRNRNLRRLVAVLWDIATFWPRANHPLTPPSYGGHTVYELLIRLDALHDKKDTRVVFAAHSQGTSIAAATLLHKNDKTRKPVGLLTFGSPLRRLYAQNFPAYFGPKAMKQLRNRQPSAWINLWAHSDPIGDRCWIRRRYTWPGSRM